MLAASIRCGKVCNLCVNGSCVDEPSELEPLTIECEVCRGLGCDLCRGGQVVYTSCPQKEVSSKILDVVSVCDVFEYGVMPKSGGLDDQDAFFVNCITNLKRNESRLRDG